MQLTRDVADALATLGLIEISQRGLPVQPGAYKGPIRLRLPCKATAATGRVAVAAASAAGGAASVQGEDAAEELTRRVTRAEVR